MTVDEMIRRLILLSEDGRGGDVIFIRLPYRCGEPTEVRVATPDEMAGIDLDGEGDAVLIIGEEG